MAERAKLEEVKRRNKEHWLFDWSRYIGGLIGVVAIAYTLYKIPKISPLEKVSLVLRVLPAFLLYFMCEYYRTRIFILMPETDWTRLSTFISGILLAVLMLLIVYRESDWFFWYGCIMFLVSLRSWITRTLLLSRDPENPLFGRVKDWTSRSFGYGCGIVIFSAILYTLRNLDSQPITTPVIGWQIPLHSTWFIDGSVAGAFVFATMRSMYKSWGDLEKIEEELNTHYAK